MRGFTVIRYKYAENRYFYALVVELVDTTGSNPVEETRMGSNPILGIS